MRLNEAYRGLLMVGRMPVAFLHLDIPPEEVDVNVHPTKVEVRFRDSNRVYSHLLATLRQTFLKSDLHSRLQANPEPGAATGNSARRCPGRDDSAEPGSSPEGGRSGSQPRATRPGRRTGRPADRRVVVRAEQTSAPGSRIGRAAGAAVSGPNLAPGVRGRGQAMRSTSSPALRVARRELRRRSAAGRDDRRSIVRDRDDRQRSRRGRTQVRQALRRTVEAGDAAAQMAARDRPSPDSSGSPRSRRSRSMTVI